MIWILWVLSSFGKWIAKRSWLPEVVQGQQAAVDLGLEDGKRVRVDTTVTETDIHHPTDNTLLWVWCESSPGSSVVSGRFFPKGIDNFSNRTRCARRRMQEIQRMTARQRHTQQKSKYRHLIGITQQLVHNARGVLENTKDECAVDPMDRHYH
jgi:IS5 family transposase